MTLSPRSYGEKKAQTFVLLATALVAIFLLCGLAIDSGNYFLSKARLSRAMDGAALAAVGTLKGQSTRQVAEVMKNFAKANYIDLSPPNDPLNDLPPGEGTPTVSQDAKGSTIYTYVYQFNGSDTFADGNAKRVITVTVVQGSSRQLISASISAHAPSPIFFMNGFSGFDSMASQSSATATHQPNLIMIVLDRSASMLKPAGGAYGLPDAVNNFLQNFAPGSDNIGIVSFSSNARIEMPITTNFINLASVLLSGTTNTTYQTDENNNTTGLKFGGNTAADEGMRLGMELMMSATGFADPSINKYFVFFTDGQFNTVRTLLAAPPYTNVMLFPTNCTTPDIQKQYGFTIAQAIMPFMSNPNVFPIDSTNTSEPSVTSDIRSYGYGPQVALTNLLGPTDCLPDHAQDYWQSISAWSGAGSETAFLNNTNSLVGAPMTVVASSRLYYTNTTIPTTNCYDLQYFTPAAYADVGGVLGSNNNIGTPQGIYSIRPNIWLPPGSVDYYYTNGVLGGTFVSGVNLPLNGGGPSNPWGPQTNCLNYQNFWYDQPTNTLANNKAVNSNVLVVPGYLVDGNIADENTLDEVPVGADQGAALASGWQIYSHTPDKFKWPDAISNSVGNPFVNGKGSLMRAYTYRNFGNLLTGFVPYVPYDNTNTSGGFANSVGMYYPSAPVLWLYNNVGLEPFTNATLGYNSAIGKKFSTGYDTKNTQTNGTRHLAYTTNMLQEVPQWAGELFYVGPTNGPAGSSLQISNVSQWQQNMPQWLQNIYKGNSDIMSNTYNYYNNTNVNGAAWWPYSYKGQPLAAGEVVSPSDANNLTGGYVAYTNSAGQYVTNRNSMCWNGRPTHYFDFITGQWQPIPNNNTSGTFYLSANDLNVDGDFVLSLCNWKVSEYAAQLRKKNVTIYTIGFGGYVKIPQQKFLAEMANATNITQISTTVNNGVISSTDLGGILRTPTPNQTVGREFDVAGDAQGQYQLQQAFQSIASDILAYLSN